MCGAEDWRDGALSDMVKVVRNQLDSLAYYSVAPTHQGLVSKSEDMLRARKNEWVCLGMPLDFDRHVGVLLPRQVSMILLRYRRGNGLLACDQTDERKSTVISIAPSSG